MEESSKIPIELPDGGIVWVEVAQSGRQNVADTTQSFQKVTQAIESIAQAIGKTLVKVGPSKATVKYGLEVTIEQGSLVAVIVRGKGKANLEITLEWEKPQSHNH